MYQSPWTPVGVKGILSLPSANLGSDSGLLSALFWEVSDSPRLHPPFWEAN